MQVGAEVPDAVHGGLVATDDEVVAEYGRYCDGETDGGHDEGFTDRTCDFVDGGLAGDADFDKGVVDAPDGAEESDKRGGGANGCEKGQAVLHVALDAVGGALDRLRDPVGEADVGEQAFVLFGGFEPGLSDEAVGALFLERFNALAYRRRGPEAFFCSLGLTPNLAELD